MKKGFLLGILVTLALIFTLSGTWNNTGNIKQVFDDGRIIRAFVVEYNGVEYICNNFGGILKVEK